MSPYSAINLPRYACGKDIILDVPGLREVYLKGDQNLKFYVKESIDNHIRKLAKNPPFDEKASDIYHSAIDQLLRLRKEILSIEERVMVV
jgi:hypothetical protein